MKKTLLVASLLGLAGTSQIMAGTVEVFLTGSTAFRANCYNAAKKLFSGGAPTIYYGSAVMGGADSGWGSGTAAWVMTGTPVGALTNLQGNTLVVHGLFTGSIQGIQTVENKQKLIFPAASGTAGGLCDKYVTNTPTIGFSDASSFATPYPADQFNCSEEPVAVLPFVFAKSNGGGVLNSITNITSEQIRYGLVPGRIPLSAWSGQPADTNTFIYLAQRTLDSGTRRTETACAGYEYGDTVGVYLWHAVEKNWYKPTNTAVASNGYGTNGVVGPAGINNINALWGPGYVGGGDIRDKALADNNANNLALGFISFSDTKSTVLGGQNWGTVISFNGMWPTAAAIGVRGNTGTNDFSPITQGYYPLWSELAMVFPSDIDNYFGGATSDAKITSFQLGSMNVPGSFIWAFNYQTKNNPGQPLLIGSIENEIESSKAGGATAIRLSDMRANRSAVGGTISPF